MRLDVFVDMICPWCYIGKRRLDRALALSPQPELQIRWRAFQLNPDLPEIGMDRRQYLKAKFGAAERVQRLLETLTAIGAAEGLDFAFDRIQRVPHTGRAHRLLAAAPRNRQGDLLDRLFAAYFTAGADLGDRGVLAGIAADSGLRPATIAGALDAAGDAAGKVSEDRPPRRADIAGIPFFVFNGRFTLSGAHEPEAFLPLFDLARLESASPRTAAI